MTKTEHLETAERLLDSAKDIARRPKESEQDKKSDQCIVMDLLDFARVHAAIAGAM